MAESKFEERHAEYMYRFKEIINLLYAEMERQYCRPN